jgi:putative tryptophan/tyrosine transport system substrate-binding protein
MRRRALLLLGAFAIGFFAAPAAFAQTPNEAHRVGVLSPSANSFDKMRSTTIPELARLGFIEGRNLVIETRSGTTEQLPALARELAATHPEVVLAVTAAAIRALRQEAGSTPIVASFIGEDPVAAGFAKSLAHPGSNVTGIVMLAPELDAKRLDLLHEVVPGARRIAALAVSAKRDAPNLAAMREVAGRDGLEMLPFYAAAPEEYESVFAAMRSARVDALQIVSAPEFFSDVRTLAELAITAKLATICEWRSMAVDGCLVGYGPDFAELQRRTADYVARILRGAAAGELPIEGPTRFEFAVNLKTAKALGLTIPQATIARADEVIE